MTMNHAPVHIVDTALVAVADHARFLAIVRDEFAPVMADAGAELHSLLATSPEIGEDVQVQITWKVPDHQAWNVTRKNFFMDPRWHTVTATLATMRIGGQRRFLYPAN